MAKLALCPRCCGIPDFDEDGRAFTCYFCCDTGTVDKWVADSHARDAAWHYYVECERRIAERAALGVPAGYGYYFDDYDGTLVLVPPQGRNVALPLHCIDNDIPF